LLEYFFLEGLGICAKRVADKIDKMVIQRKLTFIAPTLLLNRAVVLNFLSSNSTNLVVFKDTNIPQRCID
jgi:hypothetical protein